MFFSKGKIKCKYSLFCDIYIPRYSRYSLKPLILTLFCYCLNMMETSLGKKIL
jgi:hypothetical protein